MISFMFEVMEMQKDLFAMLGSHQENLYTRNIGNCLLGLPQWPTCEAWQVIQPMKHNSKHAAVLSANLASPFSRNSLKQQKLEGVLSEDERMLGCRLEVLLETKDEVYVGPGSWIFSFMCMISDCIASTGLKVRKMFEDCDSVFMPIKLTPEEIPEKFRHPKTGNAVVLLFRSSAPWLPRTLNYPFPESLQPPSPNHQVLLLTGRLLTREQIQAFYQRKKIDARGDLILSLLDSWNNDGSFHVNSLT